MNSRLVFKLFFEIVFIFNPLNKFNGKGYRQKSVAKSQLPEANIHLA